MFVTHLVDILCRRRNVSSSGITLELDLLELQAQTQLGPRIKGNL